MVSGAASLRMTRRAPEREAKNKMPYQLEMKNVASVRKVECRIG